MRRLALLVLAAAGSFARSDIAYLLDGAGELAAGHVQGPLCVFGDLAFPVVNGRNEAGAEEPLMAAARWEKGRVVVFGHTVYLEQDITDARLISNTVRWAAGEKTAPRVGIYKVPGLAARLRGLGIEARDVALDGMAAVDVVLLLLRTVGDSDVVPLARYVRAGGGLITGAIGRVVQARDPQSDLAEEFPGNRLLAPAGLVLATGSLRRTSPGGFATAPLPHRFSHAGQAVRALLAYAAAKGPLTAADIEQASATALRAALSVPLGTAIVPRLDELAASEPGERAGIALRVRRLRRTPPEHVAAHPAAAEFPGSVPPGAPRIAEDVLVQTSGWRWGWFGTGLYAAPGEVITVTLPKALAGKGLNVQVGAHTDTLWELKKWRRIPEITTQKSLAQVQTKVASAFGGAIYIVVPPNRGIEDFTVRIAGGVPAPRYIHGQTARDEWRDTIRKRPAPWAEIESTKVCLTVPSSLVRELDDPAALMETWDRISDLVRELVGLPPWRYVAERIVPDVQIEAGGMHAGYPIMMYVQHPAERAALLVNRAALLKGNRSPEQPDGVWGFFHELGHNVQHESWDFEGSSEATVKLFPLYVLERLGGVPVAASPLGKAFIAKQIARYDFTRPDFEKWKSDDLLGATMYIQLQQAFGWDAYKALFATYLVLPENQRPKTDAEKRDQWLVRFSRQVRRNLGPFFQAWGVPTSQAARDSLADLPVWMPEEMKSAR